MHKESLKILFKSLKRHHPPIKNALFDAHLRHRFAPLPQPTFNTLIFSALRKATFYNVKGGLLQGERLPFAAQKVTF